MKIATALFMALATATAAQTVGERITMPQFPAGWEQLSAAPGNIEVIQYAPGGQSAANWRDAIILEVHHGIKTLPLDALYRRAQSQNRAECDGVVEGQFQSGVNNGFASAFWTAGCKRRKNGGLGETRYTKVIQGADRVYVLMRVWRTAPFGDKGPDIPQRDIQDAMAFLTSSVVCADGDAKHPCPATR